MHITVNCLGIRLLDGKYLEVVNSYICCDRTTFSSIVRDKIKYYRQLKLINKLKFNKYQINKTITNGRCSFIIEVL